ncbi:Membrane-associated lipoprotein precursor, partial [Metamycoplasma alkalescens]
MTTKINKKSKKILFSLLGMSLISSPIFALISCTNPNKNKQEEETENKDANSNNEGFKIDPNLKYSDSDFEKDVNNLKLNSNLDDVFDLSFQSFSGGNKKENIFPSQIQLNPSILKIKVKNNELDKKIHFKVQGITLKDNANQTGEAKINVVFINKATGKRDNKIYNLSGLNKSFNNEDANGNKPNNKISTQKSNDEISKYINLNQEKRFEADNNEYLDGLKKYLAFAAGVNKW